VLGRVFGIGCWDQYMVGLWLVKCEVDDKGLIDDSCESEK
jgi:hypothetical protein